MDPHDLTPGYALDALSPEEAEAYERHLGQCVECREQLAELNETAAALAFGTAAPAPPERLRASILDAAAADRSNVVPLLQRRWVARGFAVAAAAAACIIVGLAVSLSESNHKEVVGLSLLRAANGKSMIKVSGLPAAPAGKTYEAWVIPVGQSPRPAGLFHGGASTNLALTSGLPRRAVVAVTVEPAGGSAHPTSKPIVSTPPT